MSVATDIKGSGQNETADSILKIVELLGDDGKATYYELVYRNFCFDSECFLLQPFSVENEDNKKPELLVYSPENGTLKPQKDSRTVDAVLRQHAAVAAKAKPVVRDGFFPKPDKPQPKPEPKPAPVPQTQTPEHGPVPQQWNTSAVPVQPQAPRPWEWAAPENVQGPKRKQAPVASYVLIVVFGAIVFGAVLNEIIPKQSEAEPPAAVSPVSVASAPESSVSSSSIQDEMPIASLDILGKSEHEAIALLEAHGYIARVQLTPTENEYEDAIVTSYDGNFDAQHSLITIIVGQYSEETESESETESMVPMVVGATSEYAAQILENEGFIVREAAKTTDKPSEDGIVISCSSQGEVLAKGSIVIISVGKYTAPASSVASSSQAQSSSSVASSSKAASTASSSKAASASSSKAASSSSSKASSSKAASSSNANWKPTKAPDVLLLPAADARRVLEKNGYSVSEKTIVVDRENHVGKVVQIDEKALEKQGSTVSIHVGYSDFATVPKVIGLLQSLATQRLRDAGFSVIVQVSNDCDKKDNGKVIECVEQGNSLSKGDTVTIVVGKYID